MNQQPAIQVWDILIRLFHWCLVIAFCVAYLTSEEENDWHIVSGYLVLGLISFRVLWGFWGSHYARFSEFVCSPASVVQYVKRLRAGNAPHYLGHNPLGGWMVLALLLTLFVVTLSGLKVYALEEGKGPFAMISSNNATPIAMAQAQDQDEDDDDKDNEDRNEAAEEFWEEIHEIASNFMLLLIALHVAGVVLASRAHKENLVKAMLTGKKTRP